MTTDLILKSLRTLIRKNFKTIIYNVIETKIVRKAKKTKKQPQDICMFCSSTENLTREHVIPSWTFEGNPKKFFTTSINGLNQTYNKTTIPVCAVCNNERLNTLEIYVNKLFAEIDLKTTNFTDSEIENIIRWLEIIDFKFEILNAKRRFLSSKKNGYIPYLADFPIAVLNPNINYSQSKAVTGIRRALRRLTIKDKHVKHNSLIILGTSNRNFHFFHAMGNFIFIELPQYKKAIFYFYNRTFSNSSSAKREAKKIVDTNYN